MSRKNIAQVAIREFSRRETPAFEAYIRQLEANKKVDIKDDWSTGTRFYTFSDGSRLSASEGFLFYAGETEKGGV